MAGLPPGYSSASIVAMRYGARKERGMTDFLRRRLVAGGFASLLLPPLARASDGWTVAPPASQGVATEAVEAVLADGAAFAPLRSILVARNGVLVAERYYGDASAQQPRRINSATKSVASLLVGQALAQGRLGSLSQTVSELLPEQAARAPDSPAVRVTLRQILTGTTGLAYDYTRDMRTLAAASDPVQHVLALPRSDAPPGSWSYNDAAISLLTPILERAYALKLAEIARQGLFAPLGIDTFTWGTDRSGQHTSYMGLQLRPRDFLLLGAWSRKAGAAWLRATGSRPACSRTPAAPGRCRRWRARTTATCGSTAACKGGPSPGPGATAGSSRWWRRSSGSPW
jgi:CubicO group peptidase (beta-lactamase class C family)